MTNRNAQLTEIKQQHKKGTDVGTQTEEPTVQKGTDVGTQTEEPTVQKGTDVDTQAEDPWNEHFMKIACLASLRSKDPSTPVGACVVDKDRKIVGIGYNSMPYMASRDNDKCFSWKGTSERNEKSQPGSESTHRSKLPDCDSKDPYVVHAAVNAITNRTIDSLEGCSIYVTLHPDKDCAHAIITSGITKVYYCKYRRTDSRHKGIEDGEKILKCFPHIETKEMVIATTPDESGGKNLSQEVPVHPEKDLAKRIHESKKSGPGSEAAQNYHSWEKFFMELAKLSSKRPINNDKSPTKIVGACIVSPNKQVISVASSGYPDKMPQLNADEDDQSAYITHAEAKAIIGGPKVRGCTIYTTQYPCYQCAQLIVQSGITEVVYKDDNKPDGGKKILTQCLGEDHIKRFKQKKDGTGFVESRKKV